MPGRSTRCPSGKSSLSYTFVLVFIFSLVPTWKRTAKQRPVVTRAAAVICHGTHQMGLAMQPWIPSNIRANFVPRNLQQNTSYRELLPVVRRQFLLGTLAQRGPSHGISYDACYEREARSEKKKKKVRRKTQKNKGRFVNRMGLHSTGPNEFYGFIPLGLFLIIPMLERDR